ncbi:MAG TPA: ABC transporter substrate-binding protein [Burkholderiales bacterium]
MTRKLWLAALCVAPVAALAQQTIRIGMINVTSGQFADAGVQLDNGVRTYMQKYGDTVGGRKIEIIRRDVGGVAPDVAKRLAQELIVRDKVDILTGFLLTPNTMAAADVSAEAKKFMVVMNAGTSTITTRSPYVTRVSITSPQAIEPFGAWAVRNGIMQTYTLVADYGPGHDIEAAFIRAFKEAGGSVLGSVRYPVVNADFSPYVQRAIDVKTPSIFYFVPGGAQPAALAKAFAERGVDPKKVRLLGSGEATSEPVLKSVGDAALGIVTAWHYDYKRDSALNREFVRLHNQLHKRNPDQFSLGGYDGMHLIYEALKKTGGKTDGDSLIAAAKGLSWESPRGPMSIDPETRDVIQTVYIYEVRKVGNELVNVPIDRLENVKDPVKARMK